MTHDELLAKINSVSCCSGAHELALCAVIELHKPRYMGCGEDDCCGPDMCGCGDTLPCPTIQVIEKELGNA
jgi:hypothetical protein